MNAVFTLCSNNYLGQALTLGKSYLKENPGSEFIVGLVDKLDPAVDYKSHAPIKFLTTTELNYPEFAEMQKRYNITEFNTAVKPFYFEYLFNHGYDKVLYLDPDITVYDTLQELFTLLSDHDVLLTPHTLTLTHKQAQRWQRIANNVGMYNLGFLGLKKSDNTNDLLQWWKKKLEVDCYMIPASGLFVDQIWANFFPVFFKNNYLIQEHGYNMAYWNFGERTLEKKNGIYYVNGSQRLKFFHFSNYKMSRHEGISNYTDYTREQRPDVAEIYDEYKAALIANGYEKFSKLKPLLAFRNDAKGFYQMTGLRIKVHGTRWFHNIIKFLFRV